MTKIPITLACGDYDIMRALKEGQVQPDGIDLTVLTAMDSSPRHWRFFRNRDYDMAEVSSSAYFAAQRTRHAVSRNTGLSAPALPSRLRVH